MSSGCRSAFTAWSPLRSSGHLTARTVREAGTAGVGQSHVTVGGPGEAHTVALDDALVVQAAELAEQLLSTLDDGGSRWRHTQAVAARAFEAADAVAPEQVNLLLAAAWLHDIGYAPAIAHTGFHPVDGAVHLQRSLWPPAVAGLVAHHSGARFVAAVSQLQHHLEPFARPGYWSGPVADALTWADQTTAPDGQRVTVRERLDEVIQRHGASSPQARCHAQRGPALIAAVRATEDRLMLARAAHVSTA
ncbi:metal dependent phosphohydrolase [Quadrisphaera granulorum]|uniref:Metal dependent phosphohydrolase n=1 Tax=Quadrisphaera granulorum TaxID=317664 RepID=A0A315ZTD7_9ACTN|nr:HD domain-containing protein [Quadrisphaera granulorum]PWJ48826.1 metal dependent phosphohydrolase [Quadrisphaera granulorum]SZE98308.1 metal dependent phosphohydrolase [Quadrisphaera granulorum]